MKVINLIIKFSAICVVLLTVQCTDLMEDTYTIMSPSDYYNDAEDLEQALVSVYDGYQSAFGGDNYKYFMYLEVLTEFNSPAYAKNDVHLWNCWNDVNNADDRTFNNWDDGYEAINKANIVLGRGEGIDMDETLKAQYFGEARFLRALTMFNLVRIFGGLPIPESYTESLDGLEIARETVDDTYSYIIADLEYAEENLPAKSEYDNSDTWRASRGAAQSLLGEVYLTMGSMQEESSYFVLAKEYCAKVIESGEYDLEPDFKDLWYWWNTDNKNGVESVFELQYSLNSGLYNNLHVMFGVNITEATLGCYMYRRLGPSIQTYNSYSDEDARKEGSFLTTIYTTDDDGDTTATLTYETSDLGYYPGTTGWKTASPGNIKYYDRTSESATLKYPRADIYVIRYADVLLNYAEADNELNGPNSVNIGYVNQVRNRANLDDLASSLTQEQLADSIFRERGWEFIGEGQTYFDELRTDRFAENLVAHFEDAMEKEIYMYQDLEFIPSKDFLWKIPQYDLDSNPALEQNPDNVSR